MGLWTISGAFLFLRENFSFQLFVFKNFVGSVGLSGSQGSGSVGRCLFAWAPGRLRKRSEAPVCHVFFAVLVLVTLLQT